MCGTNHNLGCAMFEGGPGASRFGTLVHEMNHEIMKWILTWEILVIFVSPRNCIFKSSWRAKIWMCLDSSGNDALSSAKETDGRLSWQLELWQLAWRSAQSKARWWSVWKLICILVVHVLSYSDGISVGSPSLPFHTYQLTMDSRGNVGSFEDPLLDHSPILGGHLDSKVTACFISTCEAMKGEAQRKGWKYEMVIVAAIHCDHSDSTSMYWYKLILVLTSLERPIWSYCFDMFWPSRYFEKELWRIAFGICHHLSEAWWSISSIRHFWIWISHSLHPWQSLNWANADWPVFLRSWLQTAWYCPMFGSGHSYRTILGQKPNNSWTMSCEKWSCEISLDGRRYKMSLLRWTFDCSAFSVCNFMTLDD